MHNWQDFNHVIKLTGKTLTTLREMEQWCEQNVAGTFWCWNKHGAHSFWRFARACDAMMFELTWG